MRSSVTTHPIVLTDSHIIDRTRAYVRESFLYARADWVLNDDDSLIDSGVIDSIGAVELIAFLQDTFGLTIPEDEITESNLGSLAAIGHYVYEKLREQDAEEDLRSP